MATQYLILTTKQAALALSEEYWTKVLGRPKLPLDVTAFLCVVVSNPATGASMLVVDDWSYSTVYPTLTNQQKNFLDNNLVAGTDSRVVAIYASLPHPTLP
jgi:hypothetical protein